MQISAYKSCAAFIRAARKAGYTGTFYNVSFVGTQALAEGARRRCARRRHRQVMPYPFSPLTALSRRVPRRSGQAVLGDKFDPNYSSMEGYVAAKTVVEGLRARQQQRDARKT